VGVQVPPFAPINKGRLARRPFFIVPSSLPTLRKMTLPGYGRRDFSSRPLPSMTLAFTRAMARLCSSFAASLFRCPSRVLAGNYPALRSTRKALSHHRTLPAVAESLPSSATLSRPTRWRILRGDVQDFLSKTFDSARVRALFSFCHPHTSLLVLRKARAPARTFLHPGDSS
jgi:hypothetical protein